MYVNYVNKQQNYVQSKKLKEQVDFKYFNIKNSKLLSEPLYILVISYLVPFLESAVFHAAAIVSKQYHRKEKVSKPRWDPLPNRSLS